MERTHLSDKAPQVGTEISRRHRGVIDLRALSDGRARSVQASRRPAPSTRTWSNQPVQPRTPAVVAPPQVMAPQVSPPHRATESEQPFTILNGFAYDLLIITALSFVSIGTSLRDVAFLVYLIVALVKRWDSQKMFRSALFCLVLIPILQALNRVPAADMFAIFTFYFLCIGVVRAIIELKGSKKSLVRP